MIAADYFNSFFPLDSTSPDLNQKRNRRAQVTRRALATSAGTVYYCLLATPAGTGYYCLLATPAGTDYYWRHRELTIAEYLYSAIVKNGLLNIERLHSPRGTGKRM